MNTQLNWKEEHKYMHPWQYKTATILILIVAALDLDSVFKRNMILFYEHDAVNYKGLESPLHNEVRWLPIVPAQWSITYNSKRKFVVIKALETKSVLVAY